MFSRDIRIQRPSCSNPRPPHGACSALLRIPLTMVLLFQAVAATPDTVFKSREPGNTTFSQYPPAESADNGNLTEIEVEGDLGGVPVRREGAYEYCGQIQLPAPADNGGRIPVELIRGRLLEWTSKSAEVEESISRTVKAKNDSDLAYLGASAAAKNQRAAQYRDTLHGQTRALREYKCAIRWGENTLHSQRSNATTELARLRAVRARLVTTMTEACGREPPLDPSSREGNEASARWKQCSEAYTERLGAVDQEIQRTVSGH